MKKLLSTSKSGGHYPQQIDSWFDKRVLVALVLVLLGIVQCLSIWRSHGDMMRPYINAILYGGALYFYYERQHQLRFPRQAIAQLLGGMLLGLVVLKLFTLENTDTMAFWGFAPAIAVLGLILLAAGFYGIKQFWRLWATMFLFAGVFIRIYWFIQQNVSITVLSAKLCSLVLWYVGFDSSTQGQLVYVNGWGIDIYPACTAFPVIFACLELLLIVYSFYVSISNKWDIFLNVAVAFVWPFLLSIIRLCIMALVVNDTAKFKYWHGIPGSNLFMTLGLIGCGLFIIIRMPERITSPPLVSHETLWRSPQKEGIVRGYLCLISLGLILLIAWPEGAAQRIAGYQFPEIITLKNWQMERSEPLSTKAMGFFIDTQQGETITPEKIQQEQRQQKTSNILMAGRHYFYQQNQTSLESVLTYVINSEAQIPYLDDPDFVASDHTEQLTNVKLKPNTPYLMVKGQEKTHLASCLTSQGQTVTNDYDFRRVSRIRDILLNPQNFAQWFLGKRLMWDRRCVWVHLASPSSNPNVEPLLVSAWEELRNYYQQNFPRF
ncbi:archaeosortase/exosortase family protein [Anabaena sp. FACHB-1237]|uniref:archaeosortase/exosortase family protein n=1 Tax=Anabaena sp. FACHB-1237 TaxID=2692769 RepID=UPI0016813B12|nr:archaeosortase/exosortase family protein [Anabaena sp. FACHB-1237]MBD2138374.1 archaeosortase/exosortase family protein [Anabaena sp. FACHB-1237]